MSELREALSERILILDGAMGTMLQSRGLSGNSEAFNFTHPDDIIAIHRAYIDAGADIIETNTFSANSISQAEYGCADRAYEMALEGARLARRAADAAARRLWVAGSTGPTSKSLTLAQDVGNPAFRAIGFDDMAAAYETQLRGLIDGGVDIILLETCFDALNTKAAVYALRKIFEASPELVRPLMISASSNDLSGRTLTGQTMEAFYRSVEHASPLSFGLNCSLGTAALHPLIRDVATWTDCAVSLHPNAGLPNELGQYDQSPESMAAEFLQIAREGILNIAGGCCGTTPAHIAAIAAALRDCPCRPTRRASESLHVSGLESVEIDRSKNFTNIAERTNVAGSRKFARLIAAGNYGEALNVAVSQIDNGAEVIDVSMDDAMLDSRAEMEKFLRHIAGEPAVAKAAVMIDSSHWETILTGLKNCQGKCIVNSISLKEGEEAFVRKAREISDLGAAVVVMAFDEKGQADTYARKIEIAARAFHLLVDTVGFRPCDVIIDPGVLAVGTGIDEHRRYGIDYIEAVRWIKTNLPGALCSGGISNLSFSFRGNNAVREAMHSVFLYHAIAAGLDMGIVNPGMLQVYDEIEPELLRCVSDVILDADEGATERLIAKASELSAAAQEAKEKGGGAVAAEVATPDMTLEQRIENALVRGRSEGLRESLLACIDKGSGAVELIEGPLMSGMAKVGELFGAGKMFLPQVVKSAGIMKEAVEVLRPFMDENAAGIGGSKRPLIVLATVKGDVHDIGKNIVGIVMRCNGFEVCDLGVMVPPEQILSKAEELDADIIGVSGLITPSLHQMEELCREMARRSMTTPLLVGGATTSALHTAVKLAPLYGHVFYGADASASAVLASRLLSEREAAEAEQHRAQEEMREIYKKGRTGDAGAAASTASNGAADSGMAGNVPMTGGAASGTASIIGGAAADGIAAAGYAPESYMHGAGFAQIDGFRELSPKELLPYFDWSLFYASLGVKDRDDAAAVELNRDALELLDRMVRENSCCVRLSARFDECRSDGRAVVAADYRLPMLRQESGQKHSLCDFVAPEGYGFGSPMGMFAVAVHDCAGVPGAVERRDAGTAAGGHHCPVCEAAAKALSASDSAEAGGAAGLGASAAGGHGDYLRMLERSVRLTFAEAGSLWLEAQMKKTLPAGFKIIKPAAGYASCPDHSLKRDILRLLPDSARLGISLTETCAMLPEASICALAFAHREAGYPEIRSISRAQAEAYAASRGFSDAEARLFLGHLVGVL